MRRQLPLFFKGELLVCHRSCCANISCPGAPAAIVGFSLSLLVSHPVSLYTSFVKHTKEDRHTIEEHFSIAFALHLCPDTGKTVIRPPIPHGWCCSPLIWSSGHRTEVLVIHRPQCSQRADHCWPTSSTYVFLACERHTSDRVWGQYMTQCIHVDGRTNLIVPLST